jgi:pentatricopeptide repeat protein
MRACAAAGEWERVVKLHERMLATSIPPTPYTLVPVLSACSALPKAYGWRYAQRVLSAAEDGAVTLRVYAAAARVYELCGRSRDALALLARMRTRSPPVVPNAHVYTAVIGSFGPSREWQAALGLLRRMGRWGTPADSHAVEAALKVCGLAGRWAEIADLVREMQDELGVPVAAVHLTTALEGMMKARREEEALALLRHVAGQHTGLAVDTRLCESALSVCARTRAWADGIAMLDHVAWPQEQGGRAASRARVIPAAAGSGREPAAGAVVLSRCVRRLGVVCACGGGDWRLALRLLPTRSAHGRRAGWAPFESSAEAVRCYNAVVHTMAKAGEVAEAEALLAKMARDGPTPDAATERIRERMRSHAQGDSEARRGADGQQ